MSTTTKIAHMPLMDFPAVAERLGVNERHIRRLVAERRIPFSSGATCCASTPPRLSNGLPRLGCRPT